MVVLHCVDVGVLRSCAVVIGSGGGTCGWATPCSVCGRYERRGSGYEVAALPNCECSLQGDLIEEVKE